MELNSVEDTIFLCSICLETEHEHVDQLILCDGRCQRGYHWNCLGLSEAPVEDPWLCHDCVEKRYKCVICQSFGEFGMDGGVFQCSSDLCGAFYHWECAKKDLRTVGDDPGNFRCPMHVCKTCRRNCTNRSYSLICLYCENAYHPDCIPPGSRFNDLGFVCSQHSEGKLPHDENSKVVTKCLRTNSVQFDKLPLKKRKKPEEFTIPQEFFDEVRNRSQTNQKKKAPAAPKTSAPETPSYKRIRTNVYTFAVEPQKEESPHCFCKSTCRILLMIRLSIIQ